MQYPCCIVGLLATSLLLGATNPPELISRRGLLLPPAPRAAGGMSGDATFSQDGRWIVFDSDAHDLVANDANGARVDVFRYEVATGKTDRVSVMNPASPANSDSYSGTVSADGRRVAFLSEGSAAEPDINGVADVFVRNFPATPDGVATTELVSIRHDGGGTGDGRVFNATISPSGRYVLFEALAADLVAGPDTNAASDIYLRDLEAKTTVRLSNRALDGQSGNRAARDAVMSADASVVAFRSDATDLVPELTGNITDLFIWTRGKVGLQRVVIPGEMLATNQLPMAVMNPVFSSDGRYLAFRAASRFGDPATFAIWWMDLLAGTNALASEGLSVKTDVLIDDLSGPVMSDDGRTLAFETVVNNLRQPRVYLWKADSGVHTMESLMQTVPPAGGEPAYSEEPVLSADGAQIAFITTNAVPGTDITTEGDYRLVVRTLATGHSYAPPVGPDSFSYNHALPEFSPDGSHLLFQTEMVLGPGRDENEALDVFLTEPATGALTLVSTAGTTDPVSVPSGFSSQSGQGLSPDGRFVVFSSLAGDVVAGDTNGFTDVFRLDRQTGETRLVSRGIGGAAANGNSRPLQVSPDGRLVLFSSYARNLVASDTNNVEDVFLTDLQAGTTVLVSAKDGGDGSSKSDPNSEAMMSSDGRWVLLRTKARDLETGVHNEGLRLLLRDVAQKRTRLVSLRPGDTFWVLAVPVYMSLTDDGKTVAFLAGGGLHQDIFIYDVLADELRQITTDRNVTNLAFTPDGSRLAYVGLADGQPRRLTILDLVLGQESAPLGSIRVPFSDLFQITRDGSHLLFTTKEAFPAGQTGINDTNGLSDAFLLNLATGTLRLVSVGDEGQLGNQPVRLVQASADGSRVVFSSFASNLVADDRNDFSDVFLWEAETGRSRLLSANPSTHAPANGLSTSPVISANGRFATFVSAASDLIAADANTASDVFGVTLETPAQGDVDLDGLADAWELDSFGNLDQGADGDPDGDGQTNLEEFTAGTHPENAASVFRLGSLSVSEPGLTLTWQSQAGVTYVVETAQFAVGPFTQVGTPVLGDGTTKFTQLTMEGDARFLRVRAQR